MRLHGDTETTASIAFPKPIQSGDRPAVEEKAPAQPSAEVSASASADSEKPALRSTKD
jgi:hypothetical protein